ncbi:hypothetical protein FT663_05317 [Candidozyma haemuli var. vulneris]|uniref:Uncharacterized protein n=1 Tax=Candidozyma haemuli TaxID=45357 RepID=A0A2V1ARE2_9ASCO|nr:hypothetical protein CXQ85_004305 [[Candida] haemuloni]KAF3985396.1 hypothetical protein FT663_05317 [[Candida] haemuloni var. vulneris]KAF3991765.1 hypothetical protein FT662_01519 [[Candida] haemuloni var. vulneris]PVH20797.1 hypothetical protein CXQ85_004305 [[Candida] haemuloni]
MFTLRASRLGSLARNVRFYSRYAKNDQIYLHETPGRIIANLSSNPAATPIGYSPSKNIDPDTFSVNKKFLDLLNNKINESIQEDFTFIIEAGASASTFMPIYDFREVPRYARVPEVDSIFGYVLVDDRGKIVPQTFDPNSMYRICNGAGLIKLSDYLHEQMKSITEAEGA